MPEVTGEASIYLYLNKTDVSKLIDLLTNHVDRTTLSCGVPAKKCKDGTVEIEATQEVTLDFEMSDYAPDSSWRD